MTDIIERRALTREPLQIEDSDDVNLSSGMKSVDEVDNVGYRFETARLRSFENWPVSYIEPEKLAAAGFYYLGEGDKVRCFECGIEICQWVEGDDPEEDHKRWSDRCRFIRKLPCGNVPIGVDPSTVPLPRPSYDVCGPYGAQSEQNATANNALTSELQLLSTAKLSSMGLGRTKGPTYPDFVSYDVRLKTFDTWPKSMPQTKEHLAHAGFYYTGKGDQTLCHHCGGGLKDWEPEDDPWEEHAKWFPNCCYLLMVKGQEYVNKVTGQQISPISTEEALQMELPSFIKKVEQPLSSECKQGCQVENEPGPSHKIENAIEVEGSSSSSSSSSSSMAVKGCKDLSNMKPHGSKSVDDARMCKICYNGELGVVFLPCGHMVACVRCAPEMTTCAVCRVPVAMIVRAFLS